MYTQIKNSTTHLTSMIRAKKHLKKKTWRKKMNLSCPQDHWESVMVLKRVADSANYLRQTLIVLMLSNWAQSLQWFQWFHEQIHERTMKTTETCKNKPDTWTEKFQTCHSKLSVRYLHRLKIRGKIKLPDSFYNSQLFDPIGIFICSNVLLTV